MMALSARKKGFQSTLPARGATVVGNDNYIFITDFNPRSPHGERLQRAFNRVKTCLFQSTLPARGATGLVQITKA